MGNDNKKPTKYGYRIIKITQNSPAHKVSLLQIILLNNI